MCESLLKTLQWCISHYSMLSPFLYSDVWVITQHYPHFCTVITQHNPTSVQWHIIMSLLNIFSTSVQRHMSCYSTQSPLLYTGIWVITQHNPTSVRWYMSHYSTQSHFCTVAYELLLNIIPLLYSGIWVIAQHSPHFCTVVWVIVQHYPSFRNVQVVYKSLINTIPTSVKWHTHESLLSTYCSHFRTVQ